MWLFTLYKTSGEKKINNNTLNLQLELISNSIMQNSFFLKK